MSGWSWKNPLRRVFCCAQKSRAVTPPCRLRLLETLLQQVPRNACVHIICYQRAQFVGREFFAIAAKLRQHQDDTTFFLENSRVWYRKRT